jgi:hypothetical protein
MSMMAIGMMMMTMTWIQQRVFWLTDRKWLDDTL